MAERLGNKFFLAWDQCVLGWVSVRRGELGAARAALTASLELCREVGEPVTSGIAVAELGEADLWRASTTGLRIACMHSSRGLSATGGATGVPIALIVLASVALARGDAGEARGMLQPLVPQMEVLGAPFFVPLGGPAPWGGVACRRGSGVG